MSALPFEESFLLGTRSPHHWRRQAGWV